MTVDKHRYKHLERLKAWKILDKAVKELAANGDVEELTPRRYSVGYLLQKLDEAQALAPEVITANGIDYRRVPTSALKHPSMAK